ncbi:hypothetical protein [Poseidonocella sp. HB161398]|uniref:hypothetical protein n=1 Tax=Poseidonocella sp. HB161398 TaxID=2320855 RepID=UPI001109648D|nr:hypothetical protein [Poseidonocella sp. HB161398]
MSVRWLSVRTSARGGFLPSGGAWAKMPAIKKHTGPEPQEEVAAEIRTLMARLLSAETVVVMESQRSDNTLWRRELVQKLAEANGAGWMEVDRYAWRKGALASMFRSRRKLRALSPSGRHRTPAEERLLAEGMLWAMEHAPTLDMVDCYSDGLDLSSVIPSQ